MKKDKFLLGQEEEFPYRTQLIIKKIPPSQTDEEIKSE